MTGPGFSELFNGGTPPSFSDPASFTGDTLIRFSDTSLGAGQGHYWTTLDTITRSDGTLLEPEQIQSILGLSETPTYIGIGGRFNSGAVYIGEAAEVPSLGANGGGLQIYATASAEAADTAEIGSVWAELGEALAALDRKPVIHP